MQTKTYDGGTARFNATLLTSMPPELIGEDMQGWIENPHELHALLRRALRPIEALAENRPQLKVWKRLKIHALGMRTETDYYRALRNAGYIPHHHMPMYQKLIFTVRNQPVEEIGLVRVRLGEIGLPHGATRFNVHKRANQLGLDLCPPETCAEFCLQYDSKEIEHLKFCMEPLIDGSDGKGEVVFGVSYHSSQPKQFSIYTGGKYVWCHNDGHYIFKQRPSLVIE